MQRNEVETDLPEEEQMVSEEEMLETGLPFKEYGEDTKKLKLEIEKLEKEYDQREKVIDRIMRYSTGIESEKALRMYSISILEKWAESLENYRADKLKKR